MTLRTPSALALLFITSLSTGAGAREAPATRPRIEVTPFIALASGFSSRIRVSLAFTVARDFSVEAEVAFRHSWEGSRLACIAPYVATSIGVQPYGVPMSAALSPTPLQPLRLGVTTRQTAAGIGVHAGAGVKVS